MTARSQHPSVATFDQRTGGTLLRAPLEETPEYIRDHYEVVWNGTIEREAARRRQRRLVRRRQPVRDWFD